MENKPCLLCILNKKQCSLYFDKLQYSEYNTYKTVTIVTDNFYTNNYVYLDITQIIGGLYGLDTK